MEFAVNVPTSCGSGEYTNLAFCDGIDWEKQRSFGVAIENLGFHGLAVPDHLITGDGATMECHTTLSALAVATDDVYLYPKTINNPLRHAPLLAKAMASLDVVSGGRLKLGIGAGWKSDEAEAYGYDWQDAPTRLRELEEAIEVIKALWTDDSVSYDGEYYTLDEAICKPKPVQDPRPPIMVGGGGEEFTLRITAKHADVWNYWGSTTVMERKLDVLEDHCDTYDTDYESIQKSWFARCVIRETDEAVEEILEKMPRFRPKNLSEDENHLVGTPEAVAADIQRYVDLGMDEIVVEFVDFPETTSAELFADQVIPEFI